MRAVLEAERAHFGEGQAAVWRSQRSVEITQMEVSLQSSIATTGAQLEDLASQSKQKGAQLDAAYSQCQAANDPVMAQACGEVIAEWKRRQSVLDQARPAIGTLLSAASANQSESASMASAAQAAT